MNLSSSADAPPVLSAAPDAAPPSTARSRISVRERLSRYGDAASPRIIGLDIARACAIIGMIAAHSLDLPMSVNPLDPTTWVAIVNGNSAGLFAVLAGVSMAIMTGGITRPAPEEMPPIRLRMLGRAAVLFVLGLALDMLNTPIAIILTSWGLLYVAVLPFVRVRRRWLAAWAAGLALIAPAGMAMIQWLFLDPFSPGLMMTVAGTYPLHVWIALMLFGMILGRSDLRSRRVQLTLLGSGAAASLVLFAAVAGLMYAASSLIDPSAGGSMPDDSGSMPTEVSTVPPSDLDPTMMCEDWGDGTAICYVPGSPQDPYAGDAGTGDTGTGDAGAGDTGATSPGAWSESGGGPAISESAWPSYLDTLMANMDPLTVLEKLLSPLPHSGSTLEMLIIVSVASTVLGACLLVARALRWPLLPLAALGSMPLTVYVLHVVMVFIAGGPMGGVFAVWMFALLVGVCVTYALAWWLFMGRGPLERLAGWASARAAR